MSLNAEKCHLIIPGNKHESLWADRIWESNNVKLLGVKIDKDLKCNGHLLNICCKANRKLTLLNRMFKYSTFQKKKILVR